MVGVRIQRQLAIKLALVSGLTTLILAICLFAYWRYSVERIVNRGTDSFVIESGNGVSGVARDLVDAGVIDEPYTFIAWSYYKDYNHQLRAGEYRIEPGTKVLELLQKFVSGEVITYPITFAEGLRFRQMLEILNKTPEIVRTLDGQTDAQVMQALGSPDLHPEGRFFPDTYIFSRNTTDLTILKQAFTRMQKVLQREWDAKGPNTIMQSKDEALILASIIEKETGRGEERGTISAVFHNRLRKGMRLQTDPTVIYGLGDSFSGDLKRKHLRTDTPYNTYTRSGLTPTPIANPGAASIHAALHPSNSKALYFVARGDGSHQFSNTLAEHNKAVVKYQLGGKKKSFSSSSD